jgi:hypothetical protein
MFTKPGPKNLSKNKKNERCEREMRGSVIWGKMEIATAPIFLLNAGGARGGKHGEDRPSFRRKRRAKKFA